ncbi:MAG: methyltransferase domain-containing protein, partial [Clostridiales bacterium]|nr:methyltransferase domain-containing protein [Clostridiales bacterium]
YRYVRHPQYLGLIVMTVGLLIQWPTIITVAMWPVLVVMYYRLAKKEEKEALEAFGERYEDYKRNTPMFLPLISKGCSRKLDCNNKTNNNYVPALRFGLLTQLYDPVMKLTVPEDKIKNSLVQQANIEKDKRILDLGCGTATLTILIKKFHPDAEVIGLDGDPKILEIARSKVSESGFDIALDTGMAFELPYPDQYFDRVFSSLMIHHLTRENKERTLKEVFRVLKPGGELHVADFGKPQNVIMYAISLVMRRLEETQDNIKGLLPEMFHDACFVQIHETARYMSIFGTISLYRAVKPE